MTSHVIGVAGEDIKKGSILHIHDQMVYEVGCAATSSTQHENITSSDFYFEKVTKPSEVYRYSTSDGTGPIINTHEYGKPMSGEMVHYPRPVHPLEEDNERLKRVIASLWYMAINDDTEGFTQLVKETLGELP